MSSINWGSVYNTPIGQILTDLNPRTFAQLDTQETNSQISTLTNQQKQDTTEINAWTTLQSDAQGFASSLAALSQPSSFVQLSATSSDKSVASAVDQSAQQGSYTISVGSLAQSEIDSGGAANMAVTDPSATLMDGSSPLQGSFSIQVGSQAAQTITIPTAGVSLNGLASLINSQANIGVKASTVQNSQGDWVLELQATETGQSITYTDTGTSSQANGPLYYLGVTGSGSGPMAGANVLQAASSAKMSFGSTYNASNAITSTSNTFSNLIPGLTVTAHSVGSTTINVAPDVSSMQSAVGNFVSAWNQWASDTQGLSEAGKVVSSGSGSTAGYTYKSNSHQELTSGLPAAVLNEVQSALSFTDTGSGTYQNLADLGLTLSSDGSLSVNGQTLATALSTHPNQVSQVFSALSKALQASSSTGILSGFDLGSSSTTGRAIGALNKEVSQSKSQVSLLKQQMTQEEQRAVTQYGQWVNQVAQYSQQYSLLNALYNQNSNSSSGG